MRKIITLLSVAVALFAGFTVWTDPILGPKVQAMVPTSISQNMPMIASNSSGSGGQPTGRYGGIGAANSVAGAVVGSVGN